jgi:uncharacterized RDD family membrane protein YckC
LFDIPDNIGRIQDANKGLIMSESYKNMLEENYSNMDDEQLIEAKLKGGLTEIAEKLLNNEIKSRGIGVAQVEEYVRTDPTNSRPADFPQWITYGIMASTGSRYIAQLVDQIVAVGLAFIMSYIVTMFGFEGLGLALVIISYIGYFLFNDAMPNGQSIGKKLLSIKVVNKLDGKDCTLVESFLRNITTIIPFVAVLDMIMMFGNKRQRLGDRIADTIVVRTKT